MRRFDWHKRLAEHHTLELGLRLLLEPEETYEIVGFSFRWTTRVDHAGPRLNLSLWRLFAFELALYDHRHWNHEAGRWYEPGEEWAEYQRRHAEDGDLERRELYEGCSPNCDERDQA